MEPKELWCEIFSAAVSAADPDHGIRAVLPQRPKGKTVVIGAGKAAAQMAASFEAAWDSPLSGVVVTRYGYGKPCTRIEVIEAAHPIPDSAGLEATRRVFAAVAGLTEDDLVVALISGGGSALLPAPPPGMSLEDEIEVNRLLLASGAPISSMNTVRKHLSLIKGGRLALAAYPARVVSLIVSDIPGDDPALVASGPTVPGAGSLADALAEVSQHRLKLPVSALRHLQGNSAEAPNPNDPRFSRNEVHVIASASRSLEAAAASACQFGLKPVILSDAVEGEARDVGFVHAAIAREIALRDRPFAKPVLLLSGGETAVTLCGKSGKGGRNSEFLLAFATRIQGLNGVFGFAADTDGIDGSEANAGAFADGTSVSRMRAVGIDPASALRLHDAWSAFHAVSDLFSPGPTGTNVNDLRAILVL